MCTSCGSLVGVNDDRCLTCGRRNPGLWGFAPALRALGNDLGFVTFVIGTCAALYIASLLMTGGNIGMGGLSFFAPSTAVLLMFGASGAYPVFVFGHWWTIFSATWLHGSALHILFNMMWVRQLGPATAEAYGAARMVIIYVVAGAFGSLLTSVAAYYLPQLPLLHGAFVTVGASGSIMGLLGAMVYYGRRAGSSVVRSEAMRYAIMLGVFGLIVPGVDNFAHAGGFAGGYLAARWLDPLRPERIDHIVGALVCLGVSILAVVASILNGLGFLFTR